MPQPARSSAALPRFDKLAMALGAMAGCHQPPLCFAATPGEGAAWSTVTAQFACEKGHGTHPVAIEQHDTVAAPGSMPLVQPVPPPPPREVMPPPGAPPMVQPRPLPTAHTQHRARHGR